MFLTKAKNFLAAQRDASQRVAQGRKYSVDLPILGRVLVPSPEQLAIYAALGGLAALEIIDWPVAVAMGVGSALVARHLSEIETREDQLAEAMEPAPLVATAGDPGAPTKTAPKKAAPAKTAVPKTAVPKTAAKKTAAKKTPAKKTPAKKAATAKVAPRKAPPRQ